MNSSSDDKSPASLFSDEVAPQTLQGALERRDISLPADQCEKLDQYCRLLWEWNQKLNLTRHTDYARFVSRDVVDSLRFAAFLGEGETVLDLGTGGGVPGVVLAIIRPDLEVSLVESVRKKAHAVDDIVRRLDLPVPVHAMRAEELLTLADYETILIRAVARLPKLLTWLAPHWGAFQRILLVKGPAWIEERSEARQRHLLDGLQLRRKATYSSSDAATESVILEIKQLQPSAANQYSRRHRGRKGRGKS